MLPNIRKMLYCTDLSDNSAYAGQYAAYLAKKTGAEVHILHVVERLSSDAKVTLQAYMLDEKTREQVMYHRVDRAKEVLKERMEKFANELDKEDRELMNKQIASVNVCESYPVEEILKKAEELDCDLIVMGTHEKGLAHTFLGSVAKSVLHHSRIPIFIVPIPETIGA